MLAELAAERPGERQVVADDDQVEVGPLVPEQGVAHGARRGRPGARAASRTALEAGQAGDPACEAVAVDLELGVIRARLCLRRPSLP